MLGQHGVSRRRMENVFEKKCCEKKRRIDEMRSAEREELDKQGQTVNLEDQRLALLGLQRYCGGFAAIADL